MMKRTAIKTDLTRDQVFAQLEARLLKQRRQLEQAIARNITATADEMQGDWQERDSPAEDELREVEFMHRANLQTELRDIDEALARLHQHLFGICVDCGRKIATRRLLTNPMVARCLDCQTRSEADIRTPSL
ncbi:MAG: TraR/DksA C4-type zinc finger protein [Acidobacteriota bacterium]